VRQSNLLTIIHCTVSENRALQNTASAPAIVAILTDGKSRNRGKGWNKRPPAASNTPGNDESNQPLEKKRRQRHYKQKMDGGEWSVLLLKYYKAAIQASSKELNIRQYFLSNDSQEVREKTSGRVFYNCWKESGLQEYLNLKIDTYDARVKDCIKKFSRKFDSDREKLSVPSPSRSMFPDSLLG
jgi:hypothetical protein